MALAQILPDLGPSVIVATNLFRDQLDRYGEADAVVDRWAAALATAADGSILVFCADDPRLVMLASNATLPSRSFGLAGPPTDRPSSNDDDDAIADPTSCWVCGRQLAYAWRSIGHLGAFACPDGHVERATPDLMIGSVAGVVPPGPGGFRITSTTLRVSGRLGGSLARRVPLGLPNAYNLAAAVAAMTTVGRTVEDSVRAIEGYPGVFGRLEWMEIQGRRVVMSMIKNTVSLAEMVQLGPQPGTRCRPARPQRRAGRRPRCLMDLGCADRAAAHRPDRGPDGVTVRGSRAAGQVRPGRRARASSIDRGDRLTPRSAGCGRVPGRPTAGPCSLRPPTRR